jgi:hypothetical protein
MNNPQRGEVWLVDLDLAAKVRPCLVTLQGRVIGITALLFEEAVCSRMKGPLARARRPAVRTMPGR